MSFDGVTAIQIPEGNVKAIAIGGVTVWEASAVDKYTWDAVFASIDAGTYATDYAIGDTVPLDLGSEGLINMQIVAFDVDDLADGSGKAPITWIAKEALVTQMYMGRAASMTAPNWETCRIRTTHLPNTIVALIPENVRNRIVTVTKEHLVYANSALSTATTVDSVWIPSKAEMEGVYNGLFPDNAARIKFTAGTTKSVIWWLRDAYNNWQFNSVKASGEFGSMQSYNKVNASVVIGFCT
jgi:hypothetical protein